jgi:hypothetical protein
VLGGTEVTTSPAPLFIHLLRVFRDDQMVNAKEREYNKYREYDSHEIEGSIHLFSSLRHGSILPCS